MQLHRSALRQALLHTAPYFSSKVHKLLSGKLAFPTERKGADQSCYCTHEHVCGCANATNLPPQGGCNLLTPSVYLKYASDEQQRRNKPVKCIKQAGPLRITFGGYLLNCLNPFLS